MRANLGSQFYPKFRKTRKKNKKLQGSSMADVKNSVHSLYLEGDLDSSMVKETDNDVLFGSNSGGSGRISEGKIDAHNVFVETTMSRFLEKYGTVKDYYI